MASSTEGGMNFEVWEIIRVNLSMRINQSLTEDRKLVSQPYLGAW